MKLAGFLLVLFFKVLYCKVIIRTVAGVPKFGGDNNFASKAYLNSPQNIFVTPTNEVYFSDSGNHVIRKVDKNGIISTVGGSPGEYGYAGDTGLATNALLNTPTALYVTADREIFFSDSNNHAIRKIFTNHTITTIAGGLGKGQGANFLPAVATALHSPSGVVVNEKTGELFVSDTSNHVVRKIDVNGTMSIVAGVLGQFGYNSTNAIAVSTPLNNPSGIFITSLNELYISDENNGLIRKVFLNNGTITTIAGIKIQQVCNFSPGEVNSLFVQICSPRELYVSEVTQEIFVAEMSFCAIRKINLINGTMSYITGQSASHCVYKGDYGAAKNASISTPYGMGVSQQLEIYISDNTNNMIRKIGTDGIIRPFAGVSAVNDPSVKLSTLDRPTSVILVSNELYIADQFDNTIKKFDLITKKTSILAGISGNSGYDDTKVANNTLLYYPSGLVWNEAKSELYFCDSGNDLIRKIDKYGIISTISGVMSPVSLGSLANQTKIYNPRNLFLKNENELYIAESDGYIIRKVYLNNGTTEIVAGQLLQRGYTGDFGVATEATFKYPFGLFITQSGEIYIGDEWVIRKVFSNGTIITIIGYSSQAIIFDDTIYYPSSIYIDSNNTMLFSDVDSNTLKRVSFITHTVEIIAGVDLNSGFTGENQSPTQAKFNTPMSIFVMPNTSSIYIADSDNSVIRKIGVICDEYSFTNTFTVVNSSQHLLSISAQANRTCVLNTDYFEPDYLSTITMQYKSSQKEFDSYVLPDWSYPLQQWKDISVMGQQLDILQLSLSNCNPDYSIVDTSSCQIIQEYGIVPSNANSNFILLPNIIFTTFINYFRLSKAVNLLQIRLQFTNVETNEIEKNQVLTITKDTSTVEIALNHSTSYKVEIETRVEYSNGLAFSTNSSRTLTTLIGLKPTGNVQSFEVSIQNTICLVQWSPVPIDQIGNMPIAYVELQIIANTTIVDQVTQLISIPYHPTNSPDFYSISHLHSGVTYLFQIRACNPIGCGNFSEPIECFIPFVNNDDTSSDSIAISISIIVLLLGILFLSIIVIVVVMVICTCVMVMKKKNLQYNHGKSENEMEILMEELISKDFHIDESKLDLSESVLIGSGANGSVFTAKYFNMDVAIKTVQKSFSGMENDLTDFYTELQFMNQNTQHSNIIRFFGMFENHKKNYIGLVMELCPNGNVANYVSKPQRLTFAQKLSMITGIASGMQYLHHHNIAHRDLKCENVLLDSALTPKIIDFGFSKVISEEANMSLNLTMNVGTAAYCAPEVIRIQSNSIATTLSSQSTSLNNSINSLSTTSFQSRLAYNKKCDVYSFAIVMWVIYFQNKNPYGDKATPNQILYHLSTNPDFRPKIDVNSIPSDEMWLIKLIQQCWNSDADTRPSFDQICEELRRNYKA